MKTISKRIAFYLYAALLTGFNCIRIFDHVFWGDECFSIRLAKFDIPTLLNATANDVHPPLYYLFVKLLYDIFGKHGYIYHLSAIIPYVLVMAAVVTIFRKKFGTMASLIFMTLYTLTESTLRYNVEVRMYSMASMLVVFAFVSLYELLRQGRKKDWILFFLFSISAAYTHYYCIVTIGMLYATLLYSVIRKNLKLRSVLILYAVTILAYIPWLSILLSTFRENSENFWLTTIPTFMDCLLFFFQDRKIIAAALALILVGLYFLVRKLRGADDHADSDRIHCVWLLSGMVAVFATAFVGIAISHLIHPLFLTRYLYPAIGIMYLIVGVSLQPIPYNKIVTAVFMALCLIILVPSAVQYYKDDRVMETMTMDFLANVRPDLEHDYVVTDREIFNWTQFTYYYNGIKHEYNTTPTLNEKYDTNWFFWQSELSEEQIAVMNQRGYTVEHVYDGNLGGQHTPVIFHVYRAYR